MNQHFLFPLVVRILVLFSTCLVLTNLASASPVSLVEPAYLKSRIGQENVVVLDTQPPAYYTQAHITGSVPTDYKQWRQSDENGLGQMLPETGYLEILIGKLGIDNDSEVIIVPVGQSAGDMAVATRIFWTLHIAGLDSLSILNTGLIGYYNAYGNDVLSAGNPQVSPKIFRAHIRDDEILNMDKVTAAIKAGKTIVDTRSPDEFSGRVSGSPMERPGALPGALNLPYDALMQADGTRLESVEILREKYTTANIALEGEQIVYCHTGHRASLSWYVSHELLGNSAARLYDGSTLEWSATTEQPLVTHMAQ